MINSIDEFKYYIGDVILYSQTIEHDCKYIYALMVDGDFKKNYDEIKRETLGNIVTMLERLDFSDDNPYISADSYSFLKKVVSIRNYWVHQGFIEFVYSDNRFKFGKACDRLFKEWNLLKKLSEVVQDVRIKYYNKMI